MEKILVITQNSANDNGALNFGFQLALLTNSKLLTVAISNEVPELASSGSLGHGLNKDERSGNLLKEIGEKCHNSGVHAELCEYDGDPDEELLFESRFIDLLILARDPSFLKATDHMPSSFVKRILSKAECPVVLAPKKQAHVEEIVFCYDGSATSLYAIKQFTYLFPEYRDKKVVLLEIRDFDLDPNERSAWILHHARTSSWIRSHYDDPHFFFIQGDPSQELYKYFATKKDTFIVMGAFGRTALSTFLKKSAADLLIRKVDLPLFISHH